MSYKKGSLRQDASNKEKLTVDINLKNSSNGHISNITIHLNSYNFGVNSKDLVWKQITSEINKQGYHNKSGAISISDVKKYIDYWLYTNKNTWHKPKNFHKITFTSTDVKINSYGEFTTTLKPNTTTDGNKDVPFPLVLKWRVKNDLKPDQIISSIKSAGYLNTPVLISSMVKKTVSDYLAHKIWRKKSGVTTNVSENPIIYFTATKVVEDKDSNWNVTIDQKHSLITRNLEFKPFDITLDWKDIKDITDKVKLSEIITQIKLRNFIYLLSANDVRTIFNNFLVSGKWDFTPPRFRLPDDNIVIPNNMQVQPIIDINTAGAGVTPSSKPGDTWNIIITFRYVVNWYESTTGKMTRTFIYSNIIGLRWIDSAPDFHEIAKNVVHQLNMRTNSKFTFN